MSRLVAHVPPIRRELIPQDTERLSGNVEADETFYDVGSPA